VRLAPADGRADSRDGGRLGSDEGGLLGPDEGNLLVDGVGGSSSLSESKRRAVDLRFSPRCHEAKIE
jgi:hypothetical protein